MPEFLCTTCGDRYEVADDLGGRPIRCRSCNEFGRVPMPAPPTPVRVRVAPSTPLPLSWPTLPRGLLMRVMGAALVLSCLWVNSVKGKEEDRFLLYVGAGLGVLLLSRI